MSNEYTRRYERPEYYTQTAYPDIFKHTYWGCHHGTPSDEIINNSINKIKKFYINKGFYNVKVGYLTVTDTATANSENLIFNITKGKKVKIKEIIVKYVDPWGTRISLKNSVIPEPKAELRLKIIEGLVEIYREWKLKLDKLNKPYYLKIWLLEHII